MRKLRHFIRWIYQRWFSKTSVEQERQLSKLYVSEHVSDFPNNPNPQVVYLLGKSGQEWLAGLVCPCGCGRFIELVLKGEHPRWTFSTTKKGSITISPSIWRNVGCRSHFFVINGKIKWC